MPTIKVELSDSEYAKAIIAKTQLGKDWREILLDSLGQTPESRRLGRPSMDDLFQFQTSGSVSHGSPNPSEAGPSSDESLDDLFGKGWAEKKKETE